MGLQTHKIRLKHTTTNDPVAKGEMGRNMDGSILKFMTDVDDGIFRYAVVAMEGDRRAGILRYRVDRPSKGKLRSCGTYVWPAYRKLGLAKRMWRSVLRRISPKMVDVVCVSDKGHTLIQSLQREYPTIKWDVVESGGRKLRQLKKPAA